MALWHRPRNARSLKMIPKTRTAAPSTPEPRNRTELLRRATVAQHARTLTRLPLLNPQHRPFFFFLNRLRLFPHSSSSSTTMQSFLFCWQGRKMDAPYGGNAAAVVCPSPPTLNPEHVALQTGVVGELGMVSSFDDHRVGGTLEKTCCADFKLKASFASRTLL